MLAKILLLLAPIVLSNQLIIPLEYQGDTTANIVTMSRDAVNLRCGGKPDSDTIILACAYKKGSTVIMPNPCTYSEAQDKKSYAHLLCHELAHINGWKHP